MDLDFDEQQEMLRKTARDFLGKECPMALVREMETDEKGYSPELWGKMAKLGWVGLIFPEKYGGGGGNFIDMAVLYEEMGRALLPGPHLSTAVLCGLTLLNCGTEEQKSEFLPKIAEGELILALALTEPNIGWDSESVTVSATPDKDDFIISGTKLFVYHAHIADYLLCVTRTAPDTGDGKGISLFLVDKKSSGITCTLLRTLAGDYLINEVVFENVRVPKANMLGEINEGWAPLSKALQAATVMLCAEMVGGMRRVYEMAVAYSNDRVQFGRHIGAYQRMQDKMISQINDTDGSWLMTYEAAWRLSEGLPSTLEVSVAKAQASNSYRSVCYRAHEIFAGVGFMTDFDLIPYTARALLAEQYLGNAAFHRKIVGHELARQETKALSPASLSRKP